MAAFESVLLVKNEVFVYKIPARTSNRGYRAAEWKLDQPDWTGRLRVVAKERDLSIKLEDKTTGDLFAQCPVPQYPDISVEQVLDSSRYFVIRIEDSSDRKAFIGLGFADRGDSFDLLVALQDHFKLLKREDKQKQDDVSEQLDPVPKLDLGFKEGQTIKLNLSKTKMSGENSSLSRPKAKHTGGAGLLPPPPGAYKVAAPSSQPASSPVNFPSGPVSNTQNSSPGVSSQTPANSNLDLFCDLTPPMSQNTQPQQLPSAQVNNDPWGDFTSASSASQPSSGTAGGEWVSFE